MNIFYIPSETGARIVQPEQIVRVEALSNYSKIYFDKGRPMIVSKVLQWCQTRLPEQMFARVHRSHLVNKMHIAVINGSNHDTLVLTNGDKIVMSRRKKAMLKAG